jgi:choline dehydrogenase-like flavoprotein
MPANASNIARVNGIEFHGTERLSVVDASIMPDVPSGFTHIPTIMIAERLSEQIASLL